MGNHNGTHVLEQGTYQVPIYIYTLQIPAGTQVQDVTLAAVCKPDIELGLNLPLVDRLPAGMDQRTTASAATQLLPHPCLTIPRESAFKNQGSY